MPLVNVKPYLERAHREQFAIGAFNANTLEQVQAIVLAAQSENAPVIIQVSHRALQYAGSGSAALGLRYMAELSKIAAESVSVPVALHLDHAKEAEVLEAIKHGFTSVMFDASDLPFEENTRLTKRLVETAHNAGVCIEAEVGEVPRADSTGHFEGGSDLTDPQDAAEFVRATGIDTLAIAIGSVHAIKDKHVRLDLDRLKAIRAQVDVPLVLHGSSGVADDCVSDGIRLGLCKVNVATQLNGVFSRAVREVLDSDLGIVDPRKYLGPARDAMQAEIVERLRFFGTSDKA